VSVEAIAAAVARRYPDVVVARGEASVVIERGSLLEALAWLRDDAELQMDFLSSITATHWPDRDPAFWVDYELRSMTLRQRMRVKVALDVADASVPSVTGIFPTANWHERETFDFYGIVFDGHPELTRILLPADWESFPLRKDEALGGVPTRFRGATMPPIDQRGMA
jgi:NADH-quinone oxidoreductase subunit C